MGGVARENLCRVSKKQLFFNEIDDKLKGKVIVKGWRDLVEVKKENVRLIMDKAQIAEYNQYICKTPKCDVVNIADLLCAEAGMENSGNSSLIKYGIITNEADVRAVPTREAYILAEDDMKDDQYQKSTLKVGEGVWILEDFDEEWKYVQARNCAGWVETRSVAECTGEEFLSWLEAENFAVITRPADIWCGGEEIHFSMGSRLLLKVHKEQCETKLSLGVCRDQCSECLPSGVYGKQCGENLLPEVCKNQSAKNSLSGMTVQEEKENDRLCIMRPIAVNGRLAYEVLDVNAVQKLEYNKGYLPYTTEAVISQAMKLLDLPYSWGNANHGLDCSGFIVVIYECFGIYLPRNTSEMRKIPCGQTDLRRLSCDEKIAWLRKIKPGSLLLFKGHVMMWLGIQDGVPFIIHEVSGYRDDKGKINNVRKCVITPLDIFRKKGECMLEVTDMVIEVRK